MMQNMFSRISLRVIEGDLQGTRANPRELFLRNFPITEGENKMARAIYKNKINAVDARA